MTITATTNRNEYPGAGSAGPFAYNFRIFAATDLRVIKRSSAGVETVLTNVTHYTVAGVGSATGTITLVTALAVGETLVIRRVRPVTQLTSIRNQGEFLPATHEDAFDHLIMVDQQQQEQIDRSVRLNESYDGNAYDLTIKPGAAGQVLGLASDGTSLQFLDAATPVSTSFLSGTGSPEGVVVGAVSAIYRQTDGTNGRTLWRKRTGTGNTGWELIEGNSLITNVRDYGAIGDGASHPLSGFYATLAAAQAVYPHATALTNEIDWAAGQAAINAAKASMRKDVYWPAGSYILDKTLTLQGYGLTMRGANPIRTNANVNPLTNVNTLPTVLRWTTALGVNGVGVNVVDTADGSYYPGYATTIMDIAIIGATGSNHNASGLQGPLGMDGIKAVQEVQIRNVFVQDWSRYGLNLHTYWCFPHVSNSAFVLCNESNVAMTGATSTAAVFNDVFFVNSHGTGLYIESGAQLTFNDCWFEGCWREAIKINRADVTDTNDTRGRLNAIAFNRCWMEANGWHPILLTAVYTISILAASYPAGVIPVSNVKFDTCKINNLRWPPHKLVQIQHGEDITFDHCDFTSNYGGLDSITLAGAGGASIGGKNVQFINCKGNSYAGSPAVEVDVPYGVTVAQLQSGTDCTRLNTGELGTLKSYTPAITTDGSAPGLSAATGSYVRIGRLIFLNLHFTVSSIAGVSGTLYASLPVVPLSSSPVRTGSVWGYLLGAGGEGLQVRINTNILQIEKLQGGTLGNVAADLIVGSQIAVSISYPASDP